jgi:hypothetical protein
MVLEDPVNNTDKEYQRITVHINEKYSDMLSQG